MRKNRKKFTKRMMAAFISMCVVLGSVNIPVFAAEPTKNYETVADASTAQNYESMLGTDIDGNRYAGRVWADKSVYTDGNVTLDGENVTNDDDFMVVYSAIGSSTAVSTETVTQSNLDVVLVMDMSSSMSTTRLNAVVQAANGLMNNVLASDNNRVGMVTYHGTASTFLNLAHYDHVQGQANILSRSNYTITARTQQGNFSVSRGYGTNLQAGIAQGMAILADQDPADAKGRTPVVIVLTDGATNYGTKTEWWNYKDSNSVKPGSVTAGVALSTLMNASYMKSAINKTYARDTKVYGISVELSSNSGGYVVMNPAEAFNATSSNSSAAWSYWQQWINGTGTEGTVAFRESSTDWTFAQLPTGSTNTYGVTKQEVVENINYVDKHYSAGSEQLSEIFEEIYTEINTPAFNPITDTVVAGGYEESVPFTYVDFIGEYMEVKAFKQVSLFGKTYNVTPSTTVAPYVHDSVNTDGTLTRTTTTTYNVGVGEERITHPVFKTNFYISDCVTIELIDVCEGYVDPSNNFVKTGVSLQTVWVYITEDALPIILSEVDVNVTNGTTTTLYKETEEKPIRLYYTVGVSNDIKDAGTDHVNLSLVDAEYVAANTVDTQDGKRVQFYSNRYGEMNQKDAAGNLVGDAHVSFTASEQNRYYYHQNNYPIFSELTDPNTGTTPVIDESEWGILYHEHDTTQKYNLTWMTWEDAKESQSNAEKQVFTVVGFYREDASTLDDTDGDDVAYMAYSTWQELRFSTVFAYVEKADGVGNDDPSQSTAIPTYLNWENGQIVESKVAGYAVTEDSAERAAYINAVESYVESNAKQAEGWSLDHVYAYLAIGSKRVTRLHNMTMDKVADTTVVANVTGTANIAYAPTYNENVEHAGGIVIWLGNNGMVSVTPDEPPTSLQISKTATDANTESTFTFTVKDTANTALAETYDAVLTDSAGETPTTVKFTDGTATVELKHGQTILIEELPIGDTFEVEETGRGKYNLQSVTANGVKLAEGTEVATVTLVAGHTATVDFVNEPKQYGNLSVVKEITHNLGTNYTIPADRTFYIQVDLGAAAAGQTFTYEKSGEARTTTPPADEHGVLEFELKNKQEVVIYGLEEGTVAKVTETNPGTGFAAVYWLNGQKVAVATTTITANATQVVVVENAYAPTYTKLSPSILVEGTKTTDKSGTWDKDFTIILERLYGDTWVRLADQIVTQENPTFDGSVNGAINNALKNEKYSQPGTYSYRVREENYGQTTFDGWTYDATLHTFDVVVVDSGMKGTLAVAEVKCTHTGDNHFEWFEADERWENRDLHFYNTFDATGTSVTLHLEKEIVNEAKSSLASVEGFQFGLYDSTGTLKYSSELTDASGEALIQIPYHYNNAQAYPYTETYTLKEIVPEPKRAGYAYDTAEYKVKVTVDLNGANVVATYTVNDQADQATATNPLVFTNTYAPTGTWQFEAEKTLTGRNLALQAEEFDFQMKWVYYRESAKEDPVAMTEAPIPAKNAADGKVTFKTITFNQVGFYFYEIKEVPGTKGGVTYDGKTYTVRVEVTDNNGTLVANAIVLDDIDNKVVFENTYAPQPVQVELKATKTLTGRSIPLMDKEFVFGLVDADADGIRVKEAVPVYANNINGEVAFTKTYDKEGTYYYLMRETSTGGNGVTTDETVYVYKVEVTDNDEGILNYKVSFRKANEQTWTPVEGTIVGAGFANTYKASGSVKIQGMKQLVGKELEAEKFSFGVHEATSGNPVTSASNGENGLFTLTIPYENLTFDVGEESKIYKYIVHEKQDVVYEHITYDETEYLVEVTVTDNGDGTVKAVPKITIEGSNEIYTGVAFYNVYNTPTIEVEKTQAVGPNAKYADSEIDTLSVKAGDTVTYFITITNYGDGYAKNVVIKDTVPKGLTLVEGSISDGGTVKDGVITWTFDKMAAATIGPEEDIPTVKTVSFSVTIPKAEESTAWKNVATVSYKEPADDDLTPPIEQDTNEVVIEENLPKIEFVKEQYINGKLASQDSTVKEGDVVTYKMTLKNTGKAAATGVVIADGVPAGLELVEGSITGGGAQGRDGLIKWEVAELAAGESISVSFQAKVPKVTKDTVWSNVATMSYENNPDNPTPDDPKEVPSNKVEVESTVPTAPKTGDTTNVTMWSTFAFASLMACGVILLIEKKKRTER